MVPNVKKIPRKRTNFLHSCLQTHRSTNTYEIAQPTTESNKTDFAFFDSELERHEVILDLMTPGLGCAD